MVPRIKCQKNRYYIPMIGLMGVRAPVCVHVPPAHSVCARAPAQSVCARAPAQSVCTCMYHTCTCTCNVCCAHALYAIHCMLSDLQVVSCVCRCAVLIGGI